MLRSPTRADFLVLFTLGGLWGSSFAAIKFALLGVSPLTVMTSRILLAGTALLLLNLLRGNSFPRNLRTWHAIFWMALTGINLPFLLVPWAEQQITSSLAAVLMAFNPIITLTLAHFFSAHEPFSARRGVAVLCGFAGVAVLMGVDAFSAVGNNLWAQLAVIAAGTGYTISGIITVRIRDVTADTLSAATFLIAAILAIPVWIILDQPWTIAWHAESFWALIYLGMVTTALAFLLRYYLIMRTGAVFLSYVAYLIPMVGIILGALMLGEMLKWTAFVAIFLILFGVYLGRK